MNLILIFLIIQHIETIGQQMEPEAEVTPLEQPQVLPMNVSVASPCVPLTCQKETCSDTSTATQACLYAMSLIRKFSSIISFIPRTCL